MLQNARVTAFTVSELLRENQQGGWGELFPTHRPRLGLTFMPQAAIIKKPVNRL